MIVRPDGGDIRKQSAGLRRQTFAAASNGRMPTLKFLTVHKPKGDRAEIHEGANRFPHPLNSQRNFCSSRYAA
jgi:hypothetical protein